MKNKNYFKMRLKKIIEGKQGVHSVYGWHLVRQWQATFDMFPCQRKKNDIFIYPERTHPPLGRRGDILSFIQNQNIFQLCWLRQHDFRKAGFKQKRSEKILSQVYYFFVMMFLFQNKFWILGGATPNPTGDDADRICFETKTSLQKSNILDQGFFRFAFVQNPLCGNRVGEANTIKKCFDFKQSLKYPLSDRGEDESFRDKQRYHFFFADKETYRKWPTIDAQDANHKPNALLVCLQQFFLISF
eukprot:TRINITY_DN2223_c0_g1_i2.p4 TRINITY_DN2223_c0_g1~~TRINITY_DN2223_c0_g1_i2.p4  ORF type:complete len:244 (-),score=16.32 TRINITY_DN2223_c0_g1_i2:2331-3062(-)